MSLCSDCRQEFAISNKKRCARCNQKYICMTQWRQRGVPQGKISAHLTPEVVEWLCEQASKSQVDMATIVSAIVVDAYYDEVEDGKYNSKKN